MLRAMDGEVTRIQPSGPLNRAQTSRRAQLQIVRRVSRQPLERIVQPPVGDKIRRGLKLHQQTGPAALRTVPRVRADDKLSLHFPAGRCAPIVLRDVRTALPAVVLGAQTAVLDLVQLAAIASVAAGSAVQPGAGADVKLAQNRAIGFVRRSLIE